VKLHPASRSLAIAVLSLAFAAFCILSPAAEGLEFVVNGLRLNTAIVPGVPLPLGIDAEIHVPIAKTGLFFTFRAAGGYEDRLILRDAATGEPLAKPAAPENAHWFYFPNVEADAGLAYRFTDRQADGKGTRTEIFAQGRFRYENNMNSLDNKIFPDANGLIAVSGIAGIGADSTYTDAARMKSGYSGELSVEYAPSVLAFTSGTDFVRVNIKTKGYLPLVSLGAGDARKKISVYAAWMATADWVAGNRIPLYALTTFGGRSLRDGLGKSVRGYQLWGYESPMKGAMSAEIRAVLPALFGVPSFRPMAYLFGDCGMYSGLDRAGSFKDKNGLILSTGAGANLGLFDFAFLGVRAGYKFPMKDDLYAVYYGDRKFFWDFTFLLHF
jgi:hypothetical protein